MLTEYCVLLYALFNSMVFENVQFFLLKVSFSSRSFKFTVAKYAFFKL